MAKLQDLTTQLGRSGRPHVGSRGGNGEDPSPTDALLTVDAVGSKRVWRLLSSRSKPGVQSGAGEFIF
jgi:hypothetical protein